MSHLHEAAEIAQKHAVQEQRKHTKFYNSSNNGDRVLIANKGERGKRKLADRWEPTVYIIVDNDTKTHIYKKGHTKVVHVLRMKHVDLQLLIAQMILTVRANQQIPLIPWRTKILKTEHIH